MLIVIGNNANITLSGIGSNLSRLEVTNRLIQNSRATRTGIACAPKSILSELPLLKTISFIENHKLLINQ